MTHDVVVVGAGPAGSAAAAVLAQRGRRVLLLEKDRFPRPKVCGEFLSASARESLERLGVRARVEGVAERIGRGSVHLSGESGVEFELPAPALGISRYCFDEMLASRATELGAETRFGARVTGVEGAPDSGFRVRFVAGGQGEETASARAVIGAWGRWDSLDRALDRGFLARARRFFGWSRDYEVEAALESQVRLYAFPGGYCGLSRVERGRVNLAGVISERFRGRLEPGWEAVVAHARSAGYSEHDITPRGYIEAIAALSSASRDGELLSARLLHRNDGQRRDRVTGETHAAGDRPRQQLPRDNQS